MILTDVTGQGLYFAVSVFCGLISGIIYDILYAARTLIRAGKIITFILDVLFFLASGYLVFRFLYPLNGFDIKWYMIMGIFGGFCIERANFKKPVAYVTEKVYNKITKFFRFAAGFKLLKKIFR